MAENYLIATDITHSLTIIIQTLMQFVAKAVDVVSYSEEIEQIVDSFKK